MSTVLGCVFFTHAYANNRLFLGQFQSDQEHGQVLINTNVPRSVVNCWEMHLKDALDRGRFSDQSQTVCDVLERSLNALRNANDGHGQFQGRIAVMMIDFTLNYGPYFEKVSEELNRRGIILFIVPFGTAPSLNTVERYRRLARSTGGDYMLLENDVFTLEHVAFWFTCAKNRVRQPVNSNVHPVQNDMIDLNKASDSVGELDFNHGQSQ